MIHQTLEQHRVLPMNVDDPAPEHETKNPPSGGRWEKSRRAPFRYKNEQPWAENLSMVMQVGLTMVGCIAFCFFIGYQLDGWIGTKGIFVTLFTLLGIVGGAVTVYRQIMDVVDTKDRDGKD